MRGVVPTFPSWEITSCRQTRNGRIRTHRWAPVLEIRTTSGTRAEQWGDCGVFQSPGRDEPEFPAGAGYSRSLFGVSPPADPRGCRGVLGIHSRPYAGHKDYLLASPHDGFSFPAVFDLPLLPRSQPHRPATPARCVLRCF